MIRIHHEEDIRTLLGNATLEKFGTIERLCSKRFGNFFSSYTQSYNKVYARHGSLFQANMKQKQVTHQQYFMQLMLYIHNNAAKHGFVNHFYDWPHSSWFQYQPDQINAPLIEDHFRMITPAMQNEVFSWFGNKEAFLQAHESMPNLNSAFE
jgi:hypothetical protein